MLWRDLKVLCMLLGQQSGFTLFLFCFICEWDSRARDKHWTDTQWPLWKELVPGTKNIQRTKSVDPFISSTYKVRLNEAIC